MEIDRAICRSLAIGIAYGMNMRPQKLSDMTDNMTNNGVNEQQAKELIEKYRQHIEQRFGDTHETNSVK